MTADYLRGLEDAAKVVEAESCRCTDCRASPKERRFVIADKIRSLAPAQGAGRCACTHEAGDSPCPLHGMDEPEPEPVPPAPKRPIIRNLTKAPAPPLVQARNWHQCKVWPGNAHANPCKCRFRGLTEPALPLVHVDDGQGFRGDEERGP